MIASNKKIRVVMPHDIHDFHDIIKKSKEDSYVFAHNNQECGSSFLDAISFEAYLIENEYDLKYLFKKFNSEGSYIGLLAKMKYNLDKLNYRDKDTIIGGI